MWLSDPTILATDLEDGLILMDPQQGTMFSLNEVGGLLWKNLPASAEDLARCLVHEYDISSEEAQQDVQYWLDELKNHNLASQNA